MSPDRQRPTRFGSERFPHWLRGKDKAFILGIMAKEPIDLRSPDILGKRFASRSEIEDVYDIVGLTRDPILVGLYESRANLRRPPLFESVEAFDLYHFEKIRKRGLKQYLGGEDISLEDFLNARSCLENGEFNEGYRQGQQYPEPIVRMLVRDIDLLIITGRKDFIQGGILTGRRTNVHLDVNASSPMLNPLHDAYPSDFSPGLGETIPLVF